jgi:L-galactonate dehydratase
MDEGYTVFKFKVGSNLESDRERLAAVRKVLGYDRGYTVMIDANQVWSVPEAIDYMKHLVEFKPVFIEGTDQFQSCFPQSILTIL